MANSMNQPELETLSYRRANVPLKVKRTSNPVIRPETRVNKADNASQPTEQPNTNAMLVKTIQGLMTCVNNSLGKLNENTKFLSCHRNSLVLQALEDIDIFQRTTLNKLQKAFE